MVLCAGLIASYSDLRILNGLLAITLTWINKAGGFRKPEICANCAKFRHRH
jgi:hypothetical protein